MKIRDIFYVSSGLRIVAEEAYKNKGNLPFVAAQTANEGIIRYSDENWLKTFTRNGESVIVRQPCITWTKNGYAGTLFYRDYPFYPGDDCGILIPREEYKDEINMKWFVYAMQDHIKSFATSKGTQGKLFNEQMAEIDVQLPDIAVQNSMLADFEKKFKIMKQIDQINKQVETFLQKPPKCNSCVEIIAITTAFNFEGGNSGLTEELIYKHKPMNDATAVQVFSSSIRLDTAMGSIDENATVSGKRIKTFIGPAIIITRNGQAGQTQYIPCGKFTTNDHAYVITLKNEYAKSIDLQWFNIVCSCYSQSYVSSKGANGTLCKERFLLHKFEVPEIEEQKQIVADYIRLQIIRNKSEYILKKIGGNTLEAEIYKKRSQDLTAEKIKYSRESRSK